MILPKGRSHMEEVLPPILEDAELKLSGSFRVLLSQLGVELGYIHLGDPLAQFVASSGEISPTLRLPGRYVQLQQASVTEGCLLGRCR
jgi:hypothetical protein